MADHTPNELDLSSAVFDAFDDAQRRGLRMVRQIVDRLEVGATERDVADLAEAMGPELGFTDWFHKPEIRFGGPKRAPLSASKRRRLARGMIVEIDVAPCDEKAFADVGVALSFGTTEEPELVRKARELCKATCGFASRWKCTGELHVYADAWANNRSNSLANEKAVGHVVMPRQGLVDKGWPRLARYGTYLRSNQVGWFNHRRMRGFYALQPRINVGGQACAFEEMIFIDGDNKRIVGRDSLDEVGTY